MAGVRTGLVWSGLERIGQQVIRLGVQIVLARLLTPDEFGQVAIVSVFVVLGSSLMDSGFSKALIQRATITDEDCSSVYYFNLAASVAIVGMLLLLAPAVGSFYGDPGLVPVLRMLSFGVILSAFGAVPQAILSKEMRFKELFRVTFPAMVVSGTAGIAVAYAGGGVWALVVQVIVQRSLQSLLLVVVTRWRPRAAVRMESLRSLAPFGARLAFTDILDTTFQQLYTLVIGRFYSATEVGLYHRAKSLQQIPVSNIQMIAGRVAFPFFARKDAINSNMAPEFSHAIKMLAAVTFPVMTLLAVTAPNLVPLLIGDQWNDSILLLQLLCAVGFLYPIQAMNLNLLMAKGRSDLFLRVEIAKKIVVVAVLITTMPFGLVAMVVGQIGSAAIALVINTHYTRSLLDYGLGRQAKDMFPYAMCAGVAALAAMLLPRLLGVDSLLALVLKATTGLTVYLGLLFLLGLEAREEIVRLAQRLALKARNR